MPGTKRKFAGKTVSNKYAAKRSRYVGAVFPNRMARMPAARLRAYGTRGEQLKAVDTIAGSGSSVTKSLNATGNVTAMNLVPAGSSFFNREGRRLCMKSIHFSGILTPTGTASVADYVRVLIVYDRQTNGALPAISDVLQNTDQLGANTTTVYSNVNLNNRTRFQVIMDERIWSPPTSGASTEIVVSDSAQKTQFHIERYIPLKGLETQYKADSATAVIGDIATGSLLLVTLAGNASGSDGYALACGWRLRYQD